MIDGKKGDFFVLVGQEPLRTSAWETVIRFTAEIFHSQNLKS